MTNSFHLSPCRMNMNIYSCSSSHKGGANLNRCKRICPRIDRNQTSHNQELARISSEMMMFFFQIYLEPQTTIKKLMFGETTISYVKIGNHPIDSQPFMNGSRYKSYLIFLQIGDFFVKIFRHQTRLDFEVKSKNDKPKVWKLCLSLKSGPLFTSFFMG